MNSIKCTNCGAENKPNVKYCSSCGYELPKPQKETIENQDKNPTKNPDKKKKLTAIIFGIIAFIIAFFGVQELFKNDFDLNNLVNEFNEKTPMQIDQYTRMDSATTNGNNNLTYHYTLINLNKSEVNLDAVNKNIRPNIIENVKNSAELEIYREHKITMNYKYYDKNGNFVTDISVTPEMYNNK